MFGTGDRITVSGSTSNDGTYNVATGGAAASIVVSESLTTEAAGDTVIISDVTDVADDSALESVVEAISRSIEAITGRRFYRNATDETRYYTGEFGDIFFCPDDIGTITTLATDGDGDRTYEDTWTATDWDYMPYNASTDGIPYTWLETTPEGDYSFPTTPKGIKIIGKFGYSAATPAPIKRACLLLAARLFKRKDMPFGRAGIPALGIIEMETQIRNDPEIMFMLNPYSRLL